MSHFHETQTPEDLPPEHGEIKAPEPPMDDPSARFAAKLLDFAKDNARAEFGRRDVDLIDQVRR